MNSFSRGVLLGSGFALGAALVLFGALALWIHFATLYFDDCGDRDSVVGSNAISIDDYRVEIQDDQALVIGTLHNTTKDNIKSVMVEASIFDTEDHVLDMESDYIALLPPKEIYGFKIHFYPWRHEVPKDNLNCVVRISQGSRE